MHILHHDVDIQVQHPVDSPGVGIDQVAADIGTRICMQDVELACLLQDSRQQRSAALRVEQVDDQRITASPCLLQSAFSAASSRSRSTITTREPAANIASVLANPMPDAAPVTTATLRKEP